MHSFGIKLAAVSGTLLVAAALMGLFAANTQMEIDGVPRAKRAEYELRMEQIRLETERKAKGQMFPSAKAVLTESSFDFGMLDPHTTASHTFEIRNEGKVDLLLKAGETSCKCTVGRLNSEVVAPLGSTQVTLEWNTGYQAEDYEQSAVVHTNDPAQPTIKLTVHGKVKAELVVRDLAIELPAVDAGITTKSSTFLYSQLWQDFVVEDVTCDLPGFEWAVDPIETKDLPEGDLEAVSAWRLNLAALPTQQGAFSGKAKIFARPSSGGELIEREVSISGRVRSPISFHDPELHQESGLDLGIMVRGTEHRRSLIVRLRDNPNRTLTVLNVLPGELKAELEPTKQEGVYRLTLIAPVDAKSVMFNGTHPHGYIEVGDANEPNFMSRMPLTGAIINPQTNG